MQTAIFQRINIGEDINNELGVFEKSKGGIRTPIPINRGFKFQTPTDNLLIYRAAEKAREMRTGGVKPVKSGQTMQITPVPPTGSADEMPKTPVSTATVVAPAPLPAMDTKAEDKTAAAPKSKTMLYVGIAAIVLIGGYMIMKR